MIVRCIIGGGYSIRPSIKYALISSLRNTPCNQPPYRRPRIEVVLLDGVDYDSRLLLCGGDLLDLRFAYPVDKLADSCAVWHSCICFCRCKDTTIFSKYAESPCILPAGGCSPVGWCSYPQKEIEAHRHEKSGTNLAALHGRLFVCYSSQWQSCLRVHRPDSSNHSVNCSAFHISTFPLAISTAVSWSVVAVILSVAAS